MTDTILRAYGGSSPVMSLSTKHFPISVLGRRKCRKFISGKYKQNQQNKNHQYDLLVQDKKHTDYKVNVPQNSDTNIA